MTSMQQRARLQAQIWKIANDVRGSVDGWDFYFIYPSQLFKNVVEKANDNDNLNTKLKDIFTAIESSANGYPSEQDIKGIFAEFDCISI